MNKSLVIIVAIAGVAVVGYIVYMSYFSAKANVDTVGKGPDTFSDENQNQAPVPAMPVTEEEKLDVLNSLAPSENASASIVSENAKVNTLNGTAAPPENSAAPIGDAEKIKLLESLRR